MIIADTNILLRFVSADDPQFPLVDSAVQKLLSEGKSLRVFPQNIYEFWVAATRPVSANGLGLSTIECSDALVRLKRVFPILPDRPNLFDEWESLVLAHCCQGKVAHDARLVAAMNTHGLKSLFTLNPGDFRRYSWLVILEPVAVIAQ